MSSGFRPGRSGENPATRMRTCVTTQMSRCAFPFPSTRVSWAPPRTGSSANTRSPMIGSSKLNTGCGSRKASLFMCTGRTAPTDPLSASCARCCPSTTRTRSSRRGTRRKCTSAPAPSCTFTRLASRVRFLNSGRCPASIGISQTRRRSPGRNICAPASPGSPRQPSAGR